MPLIEYKGHSPEVHESVFIAPSAWVSGKVTLEQNVSVFFGAVLRGDIQKIFVGTGSNLQENVVLHTSTGLSDCVVGSGVTVGHAAIVHGCEVKSNCIIGMGSTILDGAVIEEDCIIGAHSLVPMGMRISKGSLAFGAPAKVIRQLSAKEIEEIRVSSKHYIEVGQEYKRFFR